MLQSMTGYGKAEIVFSNKKITVEMRSLNSKGTDIYLKTPITYKPYEIPIRKQIQKELIRGKIECFITEEVMDSEGAITINQDLMVAYYKKLAAIADKAGGDKTGIFPALLRVPDIMQSHDKEVDESEWEEVQKLIASAAERLTQYRTEEGKSITSDLELSINKIGKLLEEVPKYEQLRIDIIRERMDKSLKNNVENVDENRFEQELIYYIEKMDINEEKARLQQNIDYFRETLAGKGAIGKKLGFIAQEIGREINTLGSKSYHADLQRLVVDMKDNLEKIKEQVLNSL